MFVFNFSLLIADQFVGLTLNTIECKEISGNRLGYLLFWPSKNIPAVYTDHRCILCIVFEQLGWTLYLTVQNLTLILSSIFFLVCTFKTIADVNQGLSINRFLVVVLWWGVLFHVCLYIQSNDDNCCLFSIQRIKFIWEINLF